MDPLQESLLKAPAGSSIVGNFHIGQTGTSRSKKNLILLVMALSISICLTIYLFLNMEVIDGNQSDPVRYKPLSRRKPMLDHESIFSDSGPSMIKLSDLLAHCIVALQVAGREVVNLSLAKNERLNLIASKGKTLEGVDDIVTNADMKSHSMIVNTIKDSYRRLKVVSEEDTTHLFEGRSAEDDILPINRTEFASLLRNSLHQIEGQHPDRGSLIEQHETLVWIDPLDATKEYNENLTSYVTLMACIVYKSIPIAGVIYKPFTNESFWSMKDIATESHYHSPALNKIIENRQNSRDPSGKVKIIVSRSHAGDVKKVLEDVYGGRAQIISAGGSGYKTIELINGNVDAYIHMTRIKKWDICAPHAILSSIPGGQFVDLTGNNIGFGDPKAKQVDTGLIASLDERLTKELIDLIRRSK